MKSVILQNSDVMEKKLIPDSDSATPNYMETSGFVSEQKKVNFVDLCYLYYTLLTLIWPHGKGSPS